MHAFTVISIPSKMSTLPIGDRTGSATMISPWVTTTCDGSIRGQGSAIFKISTLWKRLFIPVSSPIEKKWRPSPPIQRAEKIKLQIIKGFLKKMADCCTYLKRSEGGRRPTERSVFKLANLMLSFWGSQQLDHCSKSSLLAPLYYPDTLVNPDTNK